jgi:hypothetical protein
MLTSVDRQHDHRCISRAKVHRVREARHHGTTRLSMNARKVKRTGRNAFDDSVQLLAELSPQAETPGLIPLAHFECLVFGLWPEDNVQRHSTLELGAYLGPWDGRVRILQVLSPTSIKLRPFRGGQLECTFALGLTEAFPQRHRKLGTVSGRELEEFCQRTRGHEVIVA